MQKYIQVRSNIITNTHRYTSGNAKIHTSTQQYNYKTHIVIHQTMQKYIQVRSNIITNTRYTSGNAKIHTSTQQYHHKSTLT